jgi:ABC-type sugar transport system ATPase subunit
MSRPEQGGNGHSAASVLELRGVSKTYGQEQDRVHALAGVDLSVRAGEMVAVMGPSGSGKSTLLTIAGSLEDPTSGEVLVCGMPLAGMPQGRKARLRRRVIGYVFQDFNLLPGLTAAENAALPLELDGVPVPKARAAGQARGTRQAAIQMPGDAASESVRAQQDRAKLFSMGCFEALRDPAIHTSGDRNPVTASEDLAALSIVSRLVTTWDVIRPVQLLRRPMPRRPRKSL